jgi:benzoyl-CoA reductase subunit D
MDGKSGLGEARGIGGYDMLTAGIDSGFENTKIVILDDDQLVAKGMISSGGGDRDKAIEKLWNETLQSAALSPSDITKTVATGQGKQDVFFADKNVVEAVADARAARAINPVAAFVVDIGADQTRVVTLGEGTAIEEVVLNQKCMAGLGTLLKYMARRLDMTIEELSGLSPDDKKNVKVNDGCPVFAELGALELLNQGVSKEDVGYAIIDSVVVRLNSILNDKAVPAKDTTVLIGGVSKNAAVISGLKARSGINFIIPEYAEYGCALGAAAIAKDQPILEPDSVLQRS